MPSQPITSTLVSYAAAALTSESLVALERKWSALIGDDRAVDAFLCPTDPHSYVLAQALLECVSRDDWTMPIHLAIVPQQRGYQSQDEATEWTWALADARVATSRYDWISTQALQEAMKRIARPAEETIQRTLAMAVAAVAGAAAEQPLRQTLLDLVSISEAFFRGDTLPPIAHAATLSHHDVSQRLSAWETQLLRGHYLTATLRFGRQWYWGVDRLAHLERDLDLVPRYDRNRLEWRAESPPLSTTNPIAAAKLLVFWSFRSPYSQLCLRPLRALARRTGVALELRAVLPMVMRGLKVPLSKKLYIVRDAAREARAIGVPFGQACDPVGKPTERGFVALMVARRTGKEWDFLEAWADNVWASGVDAGSDDGLRRIVEAAGMEWSLVADALVDAGVDAEWRAYAEKNRNDLYQSGLWGVPSFALISTESSEKERPIETVWGQDRLFAVSDAIERLISKSSAT